MGGERSAVHRVETGEPAGDHVGTQGNKQRQNDGDKDRQPNIGQVGVSEGDASFYSNAQKQINRNGLVDRIGKPQVAFDCDGEKTEGKSENGWGENIGQCQLEHTDIHRHTFHRRFPAGYRGRPGHPYSGEPPKRSDIRLACVVTASPISS
ncbi:MAG: Uncharacterised protein [Cellulomonadaceae bacterium TMED98]|nr:MAG: Uncharacterised protein [Cellulomonadaceae bacterium TMED98]